MARTPWRARHGPLMLSNFFGKSFSELFAGYAVLFHPEMQGLVVGSKEPRRLTLVPFCVLKRLPDRLLLGIGGGRLGDLFQRGTDWRGAFLRRHCPRHV